MLLGGTPRAGDRTPPSRSSPRTASTPPAPAAIAKRAGISQPYIYALFPNKHELFLAAHSTCVDRIRSALHRGGPRPRRPRGRGSRRWGRPTSSCSTTATRSCSRCSPTRPPATRALREQVREDFIAADATTSRASAARRATRSSTSWPAGMLLNVVAALDLPDDYAPRRGGAVTEALFFSPA